MNNQLKTGADKGESDCTPSAVERPLLQASGHAAYCRWCDGVLQREQRMNRI